MPLVDPGDRARAEFKFFFEAPFPPFILLQGGWVGIMRYVLGHEPTSGGDVAALNDSLADVVGLCVQPLRCPYMKAFAYNTDPLLGPFFYFTGGSHCGTFNFSAGSMGHMGACLTLHGRGVPASFTGAFGYTRFVMRLADTWEIIPHRHRLELDELPDRVQPLIEFLNNDVRIWADKYGQKAEVTHATQSINAHWQKPKFLT